MQSAALNEQFRLMEAGANESKRGVEELRSNLKSRAEAENYFVWKLALGRHHRRGGGGKTHQRGGYGRYCRPVVTASDDEWRYINASAFAYIIPLELLPMFTRGFLKEELEAE